MQKFDKSFVDNVLNELDLGNWLFPQFALTKQNNENKQIGVGGFSYVYEMYNKERPEDLFALKVTGFHKHTTTSEEFANVNRIQWILSQESEYIMRIIDTRELDIDISLDGKINNVKDSSKEMWEKKEGGLYLQLVLLEKLDVLKQCDKFGNVTLLHDELSSEKEVLKFAFEIGQAIAISHKNQFLHRDIKLENIFWDPLRDIYKLGDFGIAKWVDDGYAETVVYTNGYGAPEIERRLSDNYNVTADIYSFGITLYLLLNDLRFPGSSGYYSKAELQYDPNFAFPSPAHASVKMSRIIRKMCSFYAEDRYQSMNEVLDVLSKVVDEYDSENTEELLYLADIATQTYKVEDTEAIVSEENKHDKTRAQIKIEQEEQEEQEIIFIMSNLKFLFGISLIYILLFKGYVNIESKNDIISKGLFFIVGLTVIYVILLKAKEFYIIYGSILKLVFLFYSVTGFNMVGVILFLCVQSKDLILIWAGIIGTFLWATFELTNVSVFLNLIYQWDLGWIVLIIEMFVVCLYIEKKVEWKKVTYKKAYWNYIKYSTRYIIMIMFGLFLEYSKKEGMNSLDFIDRIHFIRTGIISQILMMLFLNLKKNIKEKMATLK